MYKEFTSVPYRFSTGVPQGSLLGPYLFSLFILSLGEVRSSHGFSYHSYTDGNQLILSFSLTGTRVSAWNSHVWQTSHHGWQLINWNLFPAKLNCCSSEEKHPHIRILWSPKQLSDLIIRHCIQPWGNHGQSAALLISQCLTLSCWFFLCNIRGICLFLSSVITQILVQSLVMSRLTRSSSASDHHRSIATDPQCSCTTCCQPSQVLPHHPIATHPLLASYSYPHQI